MRARESELVRMKDKEIVISLLKNATRKLTVSVYMHINNRMLICTYSR